MSHKTDRKTVEVTGTVIGWRKRKSGEIKGLYLQGNQKRLKVKLSKPLRKTIEEICQIGDRILVRGTIKNKETSVLKVEVLIPVDHPSLIPTRKEKAQSKIEVGVCQKSSCCRRGANKVMKALKQSVKDYQLENTICIKSTSCLGRCKAGPAIVALPHKQKFQNVRPCEVSDLLLKKVLAS